MARCVRGLLLLVLAGCVPGDDRPAPPAEVPAGWQQPVSAGPAWPDEGWWRGFRSPELDGLIAAARTRNFDLAAAVARIRQADAQVRIAGAALLPSLDATAGASWQRIGVTRGLGTASANSSVNLHDYNLGLNAAYQVDFWGKIRSEQQSSIASAVFSRWDREVVVLTVETNVATTWFNALAFADRVAIAERDLRDAEQTLAVIQGRLDVGTATALDLAQQQSLVDGVRATIPALRNQEQQYLLGLGILVGQLPEAVTVQPGTLNDLSLPVVAPGLPSALLERRPDVAEAEAELVAAQFNIAVARAAFFPTIQLTGSGGFQNAALNSLFTPGGTVASLVSGLTQPIFDGGTLRGQLEQARGRYDELLADYRKAVVQAFTDVETALAAWRYATEQEALQRRAVDSAQRAADIARAQMAAGTVDVTTVLTAETTLFTDLDTLAQVRLARFLALLGLYKALGGGWQQPAGPVTNQFPGLEPGRVPGGVALPIGDNVR
jgi:NodT family efflux transporter outer membrane factor (OMF) lipoprotein